MNTDDIIRMAREADLGVYLAPQWQLYEQLERFFHAAYAAGAAAERKKLFALLRQMQDAYALASDPSAIQTRGQA